MNRSPATSGHGEIGAPASRQQSWNSPDAGSYNSSMECSSSPYPSLSPSTESSPGRESTAPGLRHGDAASSSTHQNVIAEPQLRSAESSPDPASFDSATDSLTDRLFRSKSKGPIAAIFIHAGAGYHSTVNEHVHLEVCSEAARLAMKFLKAGGTAVDAVEAAIKFLEDKEITNAGYGSNLSINGAVEGDATIVDHLGRSGACGSVQMVKNPISLARLIYDRSNIPLTLRRIPPNILVGYGATCFAQEHGMHLVPHQYLISRGAYERFCRWRHDLVIAEAAARNRGKAVSQTSASATATTTNTDSQHRPSAPPGSTGPPTEAQQTQNNADGRQYQTQAIQVPTLSSSQVIRPQQASQSSMATREAPDAANTTPTATDTSASESPSSEAPRTTTPRPKRMRLGDYNLFSNDDDAATRRKQLDSSGDGSHSESPSNTFQPTAAFQGKGQDGRRTNSANKNIFADIGLHDDDTDVITDTIGAIAIDLRGNIAAGSSSGGIGMKHSGRIGPAALVGVGSAVIPANPKDSSGTSVAAVTSGTGEHMATTMASHTCAERLYHNQRRAEGGYFETEYDEDVIMKSFVTDDFMNHPGVKNQVSRGAIGVLAAKKTNKGIYFYFAHNTDSFALASMSSNDTEPTVVLSRLGSQESVARGGRKIKGN